MLSVPIIIILLIVSSPLMATIADADIDSGLQRWLATLMNDGTPRNFKLGTFDNSLQQQPIVAGYIDLLQNKERHPDTIKSLSTKAIDHPLVPYILYENQQENFFTLQNIEKYFPERSCPKRNLLQKIIYQRKDQRQTFSNRELRYLFRQIADYSSPKFKYRSFLQILRILHQNNQQLPSSLVSYLDEFPNFKLAFPAVMPSTLSRSPLARIDFLLDDRRCRAARLVLEKSNFDRLLFLQVAQRVANKCYRRKKRLAFWQQLRPLMTKRYGIHGWVTASYQMANILRRLDRFNSAEILVKKIINRSQQHNITDELAKAIFLQAQIHEDNDKINLATQLYRQHSLRFADSADRYRSLRSLVLFALANRQWEKAGEFLGEIRRAQDSLPRDARQVQHLGFALLWQGRIYLELGKVNLAISAWMRLVREFFSSYYGAIAHHLLERLTGHRLTMSPYPQTTFEQRMIYELFSQHQQVHIARILYLIRLGLSQQAICELNEHRAVNNGQMFVKALLLHAAGDWAGAIKIFSKIERSFRELLPFGSERILFPKRFENEISTYASKAGLDPLFAMALIRQESLFNPQARSPAGARGLMQIMPKTALYESLRLRRSYISTTEKTQIKKALRRSNKNLFDVSTNIVLGMHYLNRLLIKYNKSTVFTLSSYNAGMTPTNRWLKELPREDPMLFIDQIPYRETKNYVKLVLRNYFYYRRWYGSNDKKYPNYLDPVVRRALRL